MDKYAVQSKFSIKQPTVLSLFVSCALPMGATILDLTRHGLPISLPSILAVQTAQPLHWIIDSVPFFTLFLLQVFSRTDASTPPFRSNANGEGQGANAAKATQLVNELKNELAKQRRIEEKLRASEEFYRNLVENTSDGIATISVDGTVTSVNHGFERMLGRLREEMVGKHYSALLSVSSLGTAEDRIRRFQSGEEVSSLFEIELLHQNGSLVAVEANTRPILDTKGTAIGFQGVYRDIAKRKAIKRGNTSVGVSSTQEISTTMPWEQPSVLPSSEIPASRPDGYSPLSQRTDMASVPTPADNKTQNSGSADEKFTGSLSTSQPRTPLLSSASEPQFEASSVPVFRLVETTNYGTALPEPQSNPSPAPAFRSSLDPDNLVALDPPSAKVVPFPTAPLPGTGPASPENTLNLDEALTRVDGDRALLCEMAGVFLDEYPMLLVTMQDALSHGNAQTLTYAVHTLKGSVGNFAAANAFEAALRLEKIARQGNLPQAKSALAELEAELARLVPLLTTLKMEIAA